MVRLSAPGAEVVQRGRKNVGMSTEAAGALVGISGRQWRNYECGKGAMNPALWLHFCIVTGQVKPDV